MTDIYSLFRRKKKYRFDFFDELNIHLNKYPDISFYRGDVFENHISLINSVGTLRIPFPNITTQVMSIEFLGRPPEIFNNIEEALCEMNRRVQDDIEKALCEMNRRLQEDNSLSEIMFSCGGVGITIRNGNKHI